MSEPFTFTTLDCRRVTVEHDPAVFFCVCIGGVQVGRSLATPAEAEAAVLRHLDDGVRFTDLSVETYRQAGPDAEPEEAFPYFRLGLWMDETAHRTLEIQSGRPVDRSPRMEKAA